MPARSHILAIDQGTTSSRALLFDRSGKVDGIVQKEFAQHYPADGWVEHAPEDIWQDTRSVVQAVIDQVSGGSDSIEAIGITNQRETTLVWDRQTGEPVHRAIVWQDRRTASLCQELRDQGHEAMVSEKTGLLLDPYFSASKIAWILDNVAGARARAERGELAFGTVDTFLVWHLSDGQSHVTDATNAARTSLYNIQEGDWDEALLKLFRVPRAMLPKVLDSAADFGATSASLFGRPLPIRGIAGDQQAATFGQACFKPGMMKSTYGTGCFALFNTGTDPLASNNRLLTTIAYQLEGKTTYALEGSIFVAGAAVQWLRDGLGIINSAEETAALAAAADPGQNVILVPAFTGLGAPYWDADARGGVFGLTRASGPAEIVRAALDAVCFQTKDLLEAIKADGAVGLESLRVDGGMVANDWLLQRLADVLGVVVERPGVTETTALGAAYLAGYHDAFFAQAGEDPITGISSAWSCEARFEPSYNDAAVQEEYRAWLEAVERVRQTH